MLEATPQSVMDLRTRTRARNKAVWTPMLAGTALALDEATLNSLYLDTIEAPVAIADEVMAVKEYERDQQFAISQQQVNLGIQEVIDGFGFVQSKLTDLYALWQIRDRVVSIKIKNSYDLIAETNLLLTTELASETLHLTAMQNEQVVLAYEKAQSEAELVSEAALKQQLIAAKESLQNINTFSRESISNLRAQIELIVSAAKRWTFLHMDRVHLVQRTSREYIGKAG